MNAHLRDIEAGALFLRSNANPPVGHVVEVALVLPTGAPLLVSGRVTRIETHGFGLDLDPPSPSVQAALAAARLSAQPADLPTAIARIDKLFTELTQSRERVEQLQREAETNRAFYARALSQAHGPRRSRGPRWDHFLSLGIGLACGVMFTLGVLVARAPTASPPPRPAEPPAARTTLMVPGAQPAPMAVVQVALRDAGVVDAGRAVAMRPSAPDDSGSLNLVASGDADVFVDGRHVGHAPVRGMLVRPGEHAVRFACRKDASRSAEQKVNVPAFADVDVEHTCE
jgi:hypothetical protein